MATYYWVGGSGTWTSASTANWSTTSGGSGGAGPVTATDDVIFNSASNATAYTVTVSSNVTVNSMTVSGPASGNVTLQDFGSTITLNGNLTIASTGVTSSNQTGGFIFTTAKQSYSGIGTGNNAAFATVPITLNCADGSTAGTVTYSYPTDYGTTGLVFTPNGPNQTFGTMTVQAYSWTTNPNYLSVVAKSSGDTFTVSGYVFGNMFPISVTITVTSAWTNNAGTYTATYQASGALVQGYPVSITTSPAPVPAGQVSLGSDITFGNITINSGTLVVRGKTLNCANLTINNASAGLYNGFQVTYGTVNVSGNYSVPSTLTRGSVSFGDSGYAFWGPTSYTSQITNITIRTSTLFVQPNFYDIVITIPNPVNASNLQSLWNQDSNSVSISGVAQNNVGTGFFTGAGSTGSWINFNIPTTWLSNLIWQGGTDYISTFQYIKDTTLGPTFTNSGSFTPTLTAQGGGYSLLNLTGATSVFNAGPSSATYPAVTFKSTAPSASSPFTTSTGKQISSGAIINNLFIEGPATTGYTVMNIPGTITTQAITVNSNSVGPMSRVIIWYDQAGGATTFVPTDTAARIFFSGARTVNATDTDFRNVSISVLSGGSITQTNTRVGDMGGNTGISTSTPRTLYWSNSGAGGTISFNNTNWSLTNGGAPTTNGFPLPQDKIALTDASLNSGATLTISDGFCIFPELDFSARTLPMTLATASASFVVCGNVNIPSIVTLTATSGTMWLVGGSSQVIYNTRTWEKNISVSAPLLTVSFSGDFTSSPSYSNDTLPTIGINRGTLDVSDRTITIKNLSTLWPYNGAKHGLINNSNSQFILTGTTTVWTATNNWVVTGPNPKIYLTNTGNTARSVNNYYQFAIQDSSNGGTFKSVDVYVTAGTGTVTVYGVFGTLDMCAGNSTSTLSLYVYAMVTDYLRVLDNSNLNSQFSLVPANGSTCQFITNWVYGQGAVGTNGSSTSLLSIGLDTTRQYGTVKLTGSLRTTSASFYGIYHYPATFDISNCNIRTAVYNVASSSSYNTALIMSNSTITLLDANNPAYFYSNRFTPTVDATSSISLTGYNGSSLPVITSTNGAVIPPLNVNNGYGVELRTAGATLQGISIAGGQTLKLLSSATVTLNKLQVSGASPTNRLNIASSTPGTRATISKNGGALNLENVNITDIATTGTAEFNAWSSTGSNNTGITVRSTKRPPPAAFLIFC